MNKKMKFLRSILFTALIMLFTTIGFVTLMHINGIELSMQTDSNNNNDVLYADFWDREHGEMPNVEEPEDGVELPSDFYEVSSPEVYDDPYESLQETAISVSNSLAALSDDPPIDTEKFSVTILYGGSYSSGGGKYEEDDTVYINAGDGPGGWLFLEWLVLSGDAVLVNSKEAATTFTMPASDVTLSIIWGPPLNNYSVTIENGGSDSSGGGWYLKDNIVSIYAGEPPAGQTFVNWTASPNVYFVSPTSPSTTFIMPDTDVVVTANWTENVPPPPTYTVTFNLNGGTRTGGGALVQSVQYGDSATPPTVTRDGFTFSGWHGSFTSLMSDRTIVATWSANPPPPSFHVVSFNRNHTPYDEVVSTIMVERGTRIGYQMPANPSRDGFTFIGWHTVRDGAGQTSGWATRDTIITSDGLALYAQWVDNTPQEPQESQEPPSPPPPQQVGTNQGGTTQGGGNQSRTNQSANNQSTRNPAPSPSPSPSPSPTPPPSRTLTGNIPDNTITEALESDSPLIQIGEGDSTVISAEALQDIKESGKILRVELQNGLIISINPDSITDTATSLDINIDVMITERATIVNDLQLPSNSIVITPSAHGEFGFSISFDISAEQLANAGLDGNTVRLFHISTDSVVTEAGTVRQNADGSVTLSISHASVYHLAEEAPTIAASIEETPVNEAPVVEAPDVEVPAGETTSNQRLVQSAVPPIQTDNSNMHLWIIIGAQMVVILGGTGFIILRAKRKPKSGAEPNVEEAAQDLQTAI